MDEDEIQVLIKKAPDHGVMLSKHQLNLFRVHLDELWDWNQRMNLTGLSSRRKMVVDLFLDSLIIAPIIPSKGKMLDVGSGAGFPALPLKIHSPNLEMRLIEANSKKVSFLKHVIRLLHLKGIEVLHGRIEHIKDLLEPGAFSLITARAVANLGQTLLWCTPYLCQGGLLVSYLGSDAEKNLRENQKVILNHGIVVHRKISYLLPEKKKKRNTVIFRKT